MFFFSLTNAFVALASEFVGAVDVGPASLDAGNPPAELSGVAVGVGAADLLAQVGHAQLSRLTVGVGAAHSLSTKRE